MKSKGLTFTIIGFVLILAAFLFWRANTQQTGSAGKINVSEQTIHLQNSLADSPKPTKRYKIGVLFPFLASPFWVNEAFGILDQAKKVGVDVVWLSADGYDNVDKQSAQIEDLAAQRVDAILIAATSNKGVIPAVERASKAGIPVFAHVTSAATNAIYSSVVDDDLEIGRQQAEFMGKALGGKGLVAMLNGPAAADWASRRVQGFKEVMSAKYPGIRIVAERNGIPDRADAQRLAEDIIAANPKLGGIFTVADGMAMGVADAMTNASRTQITLTTASFSQESLAYMSKGLIDLNVDENPVLMGRAAINNVVRGLNGETVSRTLLVPNPAYNSETARSVNANGQWAPAGWQPK